VLHVVVLLAFPQVARRAIEDVEVLEVTLVRVEPPRPLPMIEPPREPERPVQQKRERVVDTKRPAPEKKAEQAPAPAPPQLLALKEPAAEPALTVPAPEPRPAAEPAPPREVARAAPAREGEGAAGEKTTPPSFNAAYLRNPAPRYPVSARRNGEQGTVTLRVLVTREGLAGSVNVQGTSGSGALDQAAVDAVRGWRFVPARQGQQPVEAWVLVPIVFRLEGAS
jgi:protein TonB